MSFARGPCGVPPVSRRLRWQGLGRLVALARPEVRTLAAGTVCLGLASAATLAFPPLVRRLLDEAARAQVVDRVALAMLGLLALQGAASAGRYYLFTSAGERIVARLRNRLFAGLVGQDVAFFDQHRTGELLSRLGSDTQLIQTAVSVNLSILLRNLVGAIGGTALLFVISVPLAGVMLAVVPPVAVGAVIYGRVVQRRSRQAQDALARAGEVAEEALSSIRTVRTFDAESRERARYAERVESSLAFTQRRIRAVAGFVLAASSCAFVAVTGVLWYGGRLLAEGVLSAGDLTSFVLYTMIVAFSLAALADLWGDFMRAVGASERVFSLMDLRPVIEAKRSASTEDGLPRSQGRISFEAIHFAYPSRPDRPALRGLSLELEAGQTVAVVGPSGAGKSTLVSLLLRLYDPDEGRVCIDGTDLRTVEASWVRRQVGVVSQEPLLFSTSVADNIRYGRPDATDAEVREAARVAHALEFVSALPEGFETEVGERGVQLSGGQRQRVAIARALIEDPPILVFDEATSALDAESEALVKEGLEALQSGRTTLIIAHRLSTVRDADRVVVMEQGQIVEVGDHRSLMEDASGLYRRLVQHQLVALERA